MSIIIANQTDSNMSDIYALREAYHISIRKSNRHQPFLEMRAKLLQRQREIDTQQYITKTLNEIHHSIKNDLNQLSEEQVKNILPFEQYLRNVSIESLNNQMLLHFLCYLTRYSRSSNPNQLRMAQLAVELLYSFTLNQSEIILQRIPILAQILVKPEMVPLFFNLTQLSVWKSDQKSTIMLLLCTCIKEGYDGQEPEYSGLEGNYLESLTRIVQDRVSVSNSAIEQVLDTLFFIAIHQSNRPEKGFAIILKVFKCVINILCYHKYITKEFFDHALYHYLISFIKQSSSSVLDTDFMKIILKKIYIFAISKQNLGQSTDLQPHFYKIIKKALCSSTFDLIKSAIDIIKILFIEGNYQELRQYQILSELVGFVLGSAPFWTVKLEAYEAIAWMMLNSRNHEAIKTLYSVDCLFVIESGLKQSDSEIVYSMLRLIMVISMDRQDIYSGVIQQMIDHHNLYPLLNSKQSHRQTKISQIVSRLFESLDTIDSETHPN